MKLKAGDWVELNNGWVVGPLENSCGELGIHRSNMHLALFWKRNGSVHLMSNRYPDATHEFAVKSVIKGEIK